MIDAYYDGKEAAERNKRLHIFVLTRPEETLDVDYYKRRLIKFRDRAKHKVEYSEAGCRHQPAQSPQAHPQDCKVCLVVDESGMTGKGLEAFFSQVTVNTQRVS